MQDRFYAKTWIFWAKLLLLGGIGLFTVVFGVLFWTGTMVDANGAARPQAGPPMTIIGTFLLMAAGLAFFDIIARIPPLIRCYREGIECNVIGTTSLDGCQLIPGIAQTAWAILSLQGFRSQRFRAPWTDFSGADVGGSPMAYVLLLEGSFANPMSGKVIHDLLYQQVDFSDDPQFIASILNGFAQDDTLRKQLSSWSEL
jgi:hypothetical protein